MNELERYECVTKEDTDHSTPYGAMMKSEDGEWVKVEVALALAARVKELEEALGCEE